MNQSNKNEFSELRNDFIEELKNDLIGPHSEDEILRERGKYNVILLDIAMPEFSGIDVLARLKKEDVIKSENIIIFTASSITDRDIDDFVKSGAKGILKKPVSLDDLIELIGKYRN